VGGCNQVDAVIAQRASGACTALRAAGGKMRCGGGGDGNEQVTGICAQAVQQRLHSLADVGEGAIHTRDAGSLGAGRGELAKVGGLSVLPALVLQCDACNA